MIRPTARAARALCTPVSLSTPLGSFASLALLALLALLAPRAIGAQDFTWTARLDSAVLAGMDSTRTPGVQIAVAQNGRVIYTRAYGVADIETGRPVTTETLFRVGSVTKMVTAAVLSELAVAGTLDVQAPIARYVTQLEGKRVGTVTSHQLLTMTAGWIDNAVPYGRMGEGALGEVMDVVDDTLFFTTPGRVVSYSNPGYSMAGYVAERAAGKRFGTLAEEMVLRKIGMPHATFRPLHALTRDFSQGHVGQPGNPGAIVRPFTENTAQWAAGFLFASAQDMARFTIAVMDGGMLDGKRVLSEESVKMMTTGNMLIPGDTIARYAYGLMIGKSRSGETVWQHGGAINGFDAQVTMFPERKLSLVVLDNRSGVPIAGLTDLVAKELAGIAPVPAPEPPAERIPTAEERAQLVGRYKQGRIQVEFIEQGDSLLFRQGMAQLPVRLSGTDRVVMTPPVGNKITLVVVRDASGRIAFLSQSLRAIAREE
jgi:CubicO group peptidase (beta-lactamase class C family)